MPVTRYFFYVGGVLLALLFISDAYLPKLPVADKAVADLPVIRINSDRKWPERVVFDTSRPAINPTQTAKADASVPAPATVTDASAKARVREAFAQLQPADTQQLASSEPKKPEPKLQPKRKIAKKRVVPPAVQVAQQPQFGFFANNTWNSTW